MRNTPRRLLFAGALAAMALVASACGDDASGDTTVTATDYKFSNLPSTLKAGSTLTLKNDSTKELHELVAIKIPDSEKRSVADLVKLPEAEQEALFANSEPAMVLVAPPGGAEVIKAVGDGSISEKGRYAVICSIPTGADPAAFLQAMQSSTGGPPNVPGGPPHMVNGMYGEITVK